MELFIEWSAPLTLKDVEAKHPKLIYDCAWKTLPHEPGIYIFGRIHGTVFEPMYVGQSQNISERIRQHLDTNHRLLRKIKEAANGRRVVIAGEFIPKQGQAVKKCVSLAEKAVIRHFLSEGHELFNKAGVKIKSHEIIYRRNPAGGPKGAIRKALHRTIFL